MKNPLRYLPFDVAAFLNVEHVIKMNATTRGVYISALCWAWTEGSLPDDPDELAPFLRLRQAEVKRCWPAVRERFTPRDDGRLIHNRLESDRTEALDRYEKAKEAGRAGGRASAAARKGDEKDEPDAGSLKGGLRLPEATVKGASSIKQQQQQGTEFIESTTTTASLEVAADFSSRGDEEALLMALSHEGVAGTARVRELVRKHPERVRPQIDMLGSRRGLKNRPAALIQAIEENWPRPPGHIDYVVANPDPEPGSPEYEEIERRNAERDRVWNEACKAAGLSHRIPVVGKD